MASFRHEMFFPFGRYGVDVFDADTHLKGNEQPQIIWNLSSDQAAHMQSVLNWSEFNSFRLPHIRLTANQQTWKLEFIWQSSAEDWRDDMAQIGGVLAKRQYIDAVTLNAHDFTITAHYTGVVT